jgi:hypothetical protein
MGAPSQRKYDYIYRENLEKYALQIKKAYLQAIREISKATYKLNLNANEEFYFRNHKKVNEKVNQILKQLYGDIYGTTVTGINTQWDLGVEKHNELARWVFGKNIKDIPKSIQTKYFTNNADARRSFVSRKINGLNLSDRVWNNTRQFKKELELSLELGLGKGKSADQLSTSIRQYLNEPDKLYRRVRDKSGVLRLSKAAKAYNPGQGVYRSSYKNAQRLTRNENNFAYETSQFEKRKQQDFIVGIEIKVSPSHVPSDDKGGVCCICLQGRYPKDFDWTNKWHVNCLCTSLNILKTRHELDQDIDNILAGKEPNTKSKNEVTKKPKVFTNYVKENKKKWTNWKSPPNTFVKN